MSGPELEGYVAQYFEQELGIPVCQVGGAHLTGNVTTGSGANTIDASAQSSNDGAAGLERVIQGIPIIESIADATFDSDYSTTHEEFYWPSISNETLLDAIAFEDRIADNGSLSTYKQELPPDAQGPGRVVIHHTSASQWSFAFDAIVTYDVVLGDGETASFDEDGDAATLPP